MRTAPGAQHQPHQQPQPPQQGGNVAQISYEEAMATLSAMFSHIPPATLTAALRAHKWHMENTVAYLLDDSSRDYATASSADADADAPQQPPAAAPPRRYQGRGKPTTLPDDFLRVPGRPRSSSAATAASDDQLRADEALARQLQQQEAGLSRVDTRYQQHRRARSTSLQHAPSHHHSQHQRRPRVQSAPGYPPSADAGGRAPSPAEEGLEKLGKALGQAGASVKKSFGDLYARFLNSKGDRHRRMEDEDEEDEVVVFGSSGGGSSIVPPLPVQPLQQQPQGPVAVSGVATAMGGQQQQRQQQRQQQQQQHGGEEEEEDVLFSRVDSGGTGGAGNVGAQASSTTHRMV